MENIQFLKVYPYLEKYIYSSIMHNSQEVGATLMCTDWRMDKENVVYAVRTMKYSALKMKGILSHDESWRLGAKWRKSVTKELIWAGCQWLMPVILATKEAES
jgi:hypothetical protein